MGIAMIVKSKIRRQNLIKKIIKIFIFQEIKKDLLIMYMEIHINKIRSSTNIVLDFKKKIPIDLLSRSTLNLLITLSRRKDKITMLESAQLLFGTMKLKGQLKSFHTSYRKQVKIIEEGRRIDIE